MAAAMRRHGLNPSLIVDLLITFSRGITFGHAANDVFKWQCKLYDDAWGPTVHNIQKGDFCSKKGFLRDTDPFWPSCNKMMFPTVIFSYPDPDIEIIKIKNCTVNMALGSKDKQNLKCIGKIVDSLNRMDDTDRRLVYTTHGLLSGLAGYIQRHNGTNIEFIDKLLGNDIRALNEKYKRWLHLLQTKMSDVLINRY